jgi:hypothetical protein
MKTISLILAAGLFILMSASCAHQWQGRTVDRGPVAPEGSIGIGPSGLTGGPIPFTSPTGALGLQTGGGLEGSTQYTLFSGRVGNFPEGRGIPLCAR